MKPVLLAGAMLVAPAPAALADQCQDMIRRIDQLVAASAIDQQQKNAVLAMRERAQNAHDDLDHRGAVLTAQDALRMLNSQ